MSAQAGLLYFDRRPITASHMVPFLVGADEAGPDRRGEYRTDGLVMVHHALHVTDEDRHERQPHRSRLGTVITWDGRLDNREELLAWFPPEDADAATDAALALGAYDRWGSDGFARLLGDWSLVVWDPARRALVLASDYMGNRGLFCRRTVDGFVWATSVEQVVTVTEARTLDFGYLTAFLTLRTLPTRTPYEGVRAVPAGHAMAIGMDGREEVSAFYRWEGGTLRYRSSAAYADHCRGLLVEAVRTRLRAEGPVSAELSGGLDSSTLVCIANRLVSAGQVSARDLETFSYVSDQSAESDERRFIGAVESAIGRRGAHIVVDDYDMLAGASWVEPRFPGHGVAQIRRGMDAIGSRVLLSGRAGDTVMANVPDASGALGAQLQRGHLLRFVAHGRAWSLATRKPFFLIAQQALGTWLWPGRRDAHLVHGRVARAAFIGTHSLGPVAAAQVSDLAVPYGRLAAERTGPEKRDLLAALLRYSMTRALSATAGDARSRYTYPFVHRPLVEFVLAVPAAVLCAPGYPRALMHAACDAWLPPLVAQRFSKGYAGPTMMRSFREAARRLLATSEAWRTADLGLVDLPSVRTRLTAVVNGSSRSLGNLPMITVTEMWLRACATRAAGATVLDRAYSQPRGGERA